MHEAQMQGPTQAWMVGSSDMDPTASTTASNRNDKVFREGKRAGQWIQDRNRKVYLSLLVKGRSRLSADDTFHQVSVKPVLILLPAHDFYSQETKWRAHSPRHCWDCTQPLMRGSLGRGQTVTTLSTLNCLLPLPKKWRGRKDQQHVHADCKAPTSQATLGSLLYPRSSCTEPPSDTKSLTITAAVMNQTGACGNWLKPDMSGLLFIVPIKYQSN